METLNLFKRFMLFLACFSLISCQANDRIVELANKTADAAQEYNAISWETEYARVKNFNSYESSAAKLSRNSAVRVQIDYGQAIISGSGSYFKYKGGHIVVTAAHLFALGGGRVLQDGAIITTPNEQVVGRLVYIDKITDIAIFDVPKLPSRKAATFKRASSYPIGAKLYYSGFPGSNNLLTFVGTLSGEGYGTDIAMQSFAWGGSSGSGVFNENGEFVGTLVSIMVGRGIMGPQLAGSVVYIAPSSLIDTGWLADNLRKSREMRNAGF